jgi:hypothetical protein
MEIVAVSVSRATVYFETVASTGLGQQAQGYGDRRAFCTMMPSPMMQDQ